MKRNRLLVILNFVLFFGAIFFISSLVWVTKMYGQISIDEVVFQMLVPVDGASKELLIKFLNESLLPSLFWFMSMVIPFLIIRLIVYKKQIVIKTKKDVQLIPFYVKDIEILLINIAIILIILVYACWFYRLHQFIYDMINTSSFIEENYVNPSTTKITFPEKKKNLIYIYMESMESSYDSIDSNLIPHLDSLSFNNINFSNTSSVGGLKTTMGATWTIGGMVAQTSGVPLKIPIGENSYSASYGSFLGGAYSLGDVLEKNGYKQVLMLGSDAKFAGRDLYFKEHGNYEILDYKSAILNGNISSDYYVWWGYEDSKLYSYAKEELTTLASNQQPFNFTMLTVDTHTYGGYLESTCSNTSSTKILNVIKCSDKMIYEFINWIKEQPFYDNTTIIITGDHLNMDGSMYNGEDRYVYNTIINSSVSTDTSKDRGATTLDMYPTTLASLGATIEGNRLGLGVNLFSNEQTLSEEYGFTYFNKELAKTSNYYNKYILKG